MDNRLIYILIGIAIGAFLMHWLFFPEVTTETVIETKIEVDSTFHEYKEKYRVDSIKSVSLNDSIDYYKAKFTQKLKEKNITIIQEPIEENEPFSAPLRRFSGQQPFLYGNTFFSGLVAGELLEIDVTNDFKIPTVTNTITETKTVTNTIAPKGLFLGAGINSKLAPSVGADYVDKDWLIGGSYQFSDKSYSIRIAKRIF